MDVLLIDILAALRLGIIISQLPALSLAKLTFHVDIYKLIPIIHIVSYSCPLNIIQKRSQKRADSIVESAHIVIFVFTTKNR